MVKNILSGLLLFLICSVLNAQITVFPWTEDFESSTIPAGWTQQHISAAVNWGTYAGGSYGIPSSSYSGTKNAFFSADNYEQNQTTLITPRLDISGLTNPVLTFYHTQIPFDTDQDELFVYYKTSAAGSWVLLASYTTSVMLWTERQIILPETSDDFYIGFRGKSGYGLGICLDLVTVKGITPCNNPASVTVLQTTDVGATIAWDAGSSESQWQIEYGITGFTQGGGTVITTSTNPYTFYNLTSSLSYSFYIRSFCNPLYSEWIGPYNFSTNCDIVNVFPYNESFENTSAPAPCWKIVYANASPNSGNLVSHSSQFSFDGSRSVKFCSYHIGAPYNQYLISRQFSFANEMQLNFRYRKNTSGNEIFTIGTSSTNDNISSFTWNTDVADASTAWKYYSLNIPANTKYIAIQYKSSFQNALFVDDLEIRNSSQCYEPIDVIINEIGPDEATVNWTATNGETDWIIEYGTSGFTLGMGNIINTSENPFTITGIDYETEYDVYVKSDCGASESGVTNKISFTTTPSCMPITNFIVTNNTNTSISLSWADNGAIFYEIEYGVSGFTLGTGTVISSLNTNSHSVNSLLQNTEYDFYIRAYCGATYGFSDWSSHLSHTTYLCGVGCFYTFTLMDNWGDGWGNASISVYQDSELTNTLSLSNGNSAEYQVLICPGADIEIVYNAGSFADECSFNVYTPFNVFVYSQAYETLSLVPDQTVLKTFTGDCTEPSCYPPQNPIYSNLTYNSCLLTWSQGADENLWDVEYGLAGFAIGTGTMVSDISEMSLLLEGLIPSQAYDIYFYSDCGLSGTSLPTGPISFTTLSFPLDLGLCGLNFDIPDNSFALINFEVSGYVPSSIYTHFNLESISFIIEHPYDGDIDMYLESPEGITVAIIEDVGGIDDNFGDVSGSCIFKTVLSINPVNGNISSGTAPFNGIYSGTGDIANFNTGADINGLWKLKIVDDNNLFTGKLQYFDINFIETKVLRTDGNMFFENIANNGSIQNVINIELYNETFAVTGSLIESTDYTTTNLPNGLTAEIEITGPTTATVTLSGNATNHLDDIYNLIISFNDDVFTGADASNIEGAEQVFSIDFLAILDIIANSVDDIIICANDSYPVYVPFSITNISEIDLSAGTQIDMMVEYPIGNPVFTDSFILEADLPIGESFMGQSYTALYFGTAEEHFVSTEFFISDELILTNNENTVLFTGVTHSISFPDAVNDTIYVNGFPFSVSVSSEFTPPEFLETLYYFWNGTSGPSSYDVSSEGWLYLNTESSYCNVSDSIYIALTTNIDLAVVPDISIYPNPTNDVLFIDSNIHSIEIIKIYGIDGRLYEILSFPKQIDTYEISVTYLLPGMYFVIIEAENQSIRKNFIKL